MKVKCAKCGTKTEAGKPCASCGAPPPKASGCLVVALMIASVCYGYSKLHPDDAPSVAAAPPSAVESSSPPAAPPPKTEPPAPTAAPAPSSGQWYQGGTLHKAGALEWQRATPENKLATCADLVSALWMERRLAPRLQGEIHSIDDMRVPAIQLRTALDKAFEGSADPALNRKMLTNQTVASAAAMLMAMMGWLELSAPGAPE